MKILSVQKTVDVHTSAISSLATKLEIYPQEISSYQCENKETENARNAAAPTTKKLVTHKEKTEMPLENESARSR